MRYFSVMALCFVVAGCGKGDDTAIDTSVIETGDVTETGDITTSCDGEIVEMEPETGADDWFYRDSMRVIFSDAAQSAVFELEQTDTGGEVATAVSWGEGNLIATITPDEPLMGAASYTLTATHCGISEQSLFTTSDYGLPVEGGADALVGLTSAVLFGDVNFTQPENIGMLLGLYMDIPVLVGVTAAENGLIDVVAGLGFFDAVTGYGQRMNEPTWDLGSVDLEGDVFFSATAALVDLGSDGVSIPVTDFHMEGSFASDGTHFSGGLLNGLVDTRHMSALFSSSDPYYVCIDLVRPFGVYCEACPDGEEFCLFLQGEDITSAPAPGLSIVVVE